MTEYEEREQRFNAIRVQMIDRARGIIAEERIEGVVEDPAGTFMQGRARASVFVENGQLCVMTSQPMPLFVFGENPVEAGAREIARWLSDPFAQL
jgi:hypothetical protein